MFQKPSPTNLKPCWHMQTLVSAWLDGRLTGLARRYTERHIRGCPQCQSSLPFLRTLHFRLTAIAENSAPEKQLSRDRWQAVEAAWARAEVQAGSSPPEDEGENGKTRP